MVDKRKHRGAHPEDARLFSRANIPIIRAAVADLSSLLSKGYADKSSLKLVGDHFRLTQRQRLAVMRSACSDDQLKLRLSGKLDIDAAAAQSIVIDGYNLLITIEACLSGGLTFVCRDGCIRDLASVHGTYRRVEETIPAVELIAAFLSKLEAADVLWLFDRPVSNSGKLKTLICELAEKNNWPWQVELPQSPDKELIATDKIIVTSDSNILDRCTRWMDLSTCIINNRLCNKKQPWLIDLREDQGLPAK